MQGECARRAAGTAGTQAGICIHIHAAAVSERKACSETAPGQRQHLRGSRLGVVCVCVRINCGRVNGAWCANKLTRRTHKFCCSGSVKPESSVKRGRWWWWPVACTPGRLQSPRQSPPRFLSSLKPELRGRLGRCVAQISIIITHTCTLHSTTPARHGGGRGCWWGQGIGTCELLSTLGRQSSLLASHDCASHEAAGAGAVV